jgi:hypothetical protein
MNVVPTLASMGRGTKPLHAATQHFEPGQLHHARAFFVRCNALLCEVLWWALVEIPRWQQGV